MIPIGGYSSIITVKVIIQKGISLGDDSLRGSWERGCCKEERKVSKVSRWAESC